MTEHVAAEEAANGAAEDAALGAAEGDTQGIKEAWTKEGAREKCLIPKGGEDKGAGEEDVRRGLTGEVGTTKTGDEVVTEGVEQEGTEEGTVGGVTTIKGTPGRERDVVHVMDAGLEEEKVVSVLRHLDLEGV